MPHTSHNGLTKKHSDALIRLLGESLIAIDKRTASKFVTEFWTHSEQMMFAKRLSALALLENGESPYRVWNTLKISPSTAEAVHTKYETGSYKSVLSVLRGKRTLWLGFVNTLSELVRAGLSPAGKKRLDAMKRNKTK